MPGKYRCVFGCNTEGVTVHDFPNPTKFPQRFKTWVTLVGYSLENLREDEIYRKKKVCQIHFTQIDMNRNKRLNAIAIPSLHLTGPVPVPSLAANNKECGEGGLDDVLEPVQNTGISAAIAAEHNYCRSIVQEETRELSSLHVNLPSTSKSADSTDKRIAKPKFQLRIYDQSQRKLIRNLRREVYRLRKRGSAFKTRLENAEKMTRSIAFQKVTKNMTVPAKLFTSMQLYHSTKKPKGRRFTLEEKCLSLGLYKRSPKCYTMLYKYFTLPSAKTLKMLLSHIKIGPGINNSVFDKIKQTVSLMSADDKLCSLIFDEMSLTPQLHYDVSNDVIKGYNTVGETKIADHALVFMIRGIKKKFKQPVAYYFTQNLNKLELRNILIDVVQHVQATGLKIICTICDQSSVNVSTMNSLINESRVKYQTECEFYQIGKLKIIHLYDVPHLIKGIRNNLINKNLMYLDIKENREKIIKWEYFQEIYEADKTYGELRYLPKITEEHVNPAKINKMRVKLATQLFSRSVAVAAEHMASKGDVSIECKNIIPFVLLINKLFDTLNVSSFKDKHGNKFKNAVKPHSPHHEVWQDAINFLKNVKYLVNKKEGGKIRLVETVVPSLTNFVKTIEGIKMIWKILNGKYGFDSLLTRNFNQDPVENFFGSIRSLGVRNISPNTLNFESSYKTLLLNNYCTRHSLKSNCEEDYNTCLQSFEFLINKESGDGYEIEKTSIKGADRDIIITNNLEIEEKSISQRNYVCGWVLKKCLKQIIKGCKTCKDIVLEINENESNLYIKQKEYENKIWLCYPSDALTKCFLEVQNVTIAFLKSNKCKDNLRKEIKGITELLINYPFTCSRHTNLKDFFENNTINIIIYSWCRSVNRILAGQITYDGDDDEVKLAAQAYCNKNRFYKNKK